MLFPLKTLLKRQQILVASRIGFIILNMKKIVLFLIGFILVIQSGAQVYYNPGFKSINNEAFRIKEIQKDKESLVFIFEFNSSKSSEGSSSYINISKKLYLIDRHTKEKFYVSDKWGIEYRPNKTKYYGSQKIEFELTFDDVPEESIYLDLVDGNSLFIEGISIFFDLKLTVTAKTPSGGYVKNGYVTIYEESKLVSKKKIDDVGEAYFDNYELENNKNYKVKLKQNGALIGESDLSTFIVNASEYLFVDIKENRNIARVSKSIDPIIPLTGINYDNPKNKFQADKDIRITRVNLNNNYTTLYFEYVRGNSNDRYIYLAPPNSSEAYYIKVNGRKYKLITTSGIGSRDGVTLSQKYVSIQFSATFEAIPKSTNSFDLIEGSLGSWNFYGVELNSSSEKTLKSTKNNNSTTNDRITSMPGLSKPPLNSMLSEVKKIIILNKPIRTGHIPAFKTLFEYLKSNGFKVEYMDENYIESKNRCNEIFTALYFDYNLQRFSNVKWTFQSPCNNYTWEFTSNKIVKAGIYDNTKDNFHKVLKGMYRF